MGCDIHMYIEVKKEGEWILYPGKWPNPMYDPKSDWSMNAPKMADQHHSPYPPIKGFEDEEESKIHAAFYTNRNYDFFGMLANVRNSGFGGIQYAGKKIAQPRGVPDDACQEIKDEEESWGGDGHSHSWLSLQELNDFDWHGLFMSKHQGVVSYTEYIWFRKYGKPKSWAGDVMGARVKKISNEEMNKLVNDNESVNGAVECAHCGVFNIHKLTCDKCGAPLKLSAQANPNLGEYFTRITWGESYYESASDFVDYYLPLLNTFAKDYEDLRIVFWFDN